MGITQNTGASSLIKPGVIDNTDARPASPYEGQVIFQKDTDQLLVWNGTAWVVFSDAINPRAVTAIIPTAQSGCTVNNSGLVTFTNVANFEIKSAFVSNINSYKFVINIQRAVGGSDTEFLFRFAKNGTPQAGATDYAYTSEQRYATVQTNNGSNGATSIPVGRFATYKSLYTGEILYPMDNTVYSAIVSEGTNVQNALTADANTCRGYVRVLDSFDGLQIYCAVNITGTLRIYGYN